MKFALLTLALSLSSLSLHAEQSNENAYTLKVRTEINKKLGLSNTEEFEIVKQGHTTFGKYCEVQIEQNIDSANGLYYIIIDIPGQDSNSTSFQFHEGLKNTKEGNFKYSEAMDIVKSDASKLSLSLTDRKCSGGYLTQFCDSSIRTLDISTAKKGKIKVETTGSYKGLKSLWLSEKSTCIIDAE